MEHRNKIYGNIYLILSTDIYYIKTQNQGILFPRKGIRLNTNCIGTERHRTLSAQTQIAKVEVLIAVLL